MDDRPHWRTMGFVNFSLHLLYNEAFSSFAVIIVIIGIIIEMFAGDTFWSNSGLIEIQARARQTFANADGRTTMRLMDKSGKCKCAMERRLR